MDPSYSPYTGSQFGATPGAGGFSGTQPGAGFGSSASTGIQPGFGSGAGSSISSGTGDIVLSKTGGKSKKPLIIGLIVFAILAIAGAVAAVVVMNMNPKRTAEEEYAYLYDIISKYAFDVYNVNSFVKEKYSDGLTFRELNDVCSVIGRSQERIGAFGDSLAKAAYGEMSDDIAGIVKGFVKDTSPAYSEKMNGYFAILNQLCEGLATTNETDIVEFVANYELSDDLEKYLLSGLNTMRLKDQYQTQCLESGDSDNGTCQELLEQVGFFSRQIRDKNVLKDAFRSFVSKDDLDFLMLFEKDMNIIMNGLYSFLDYDSEDNGGVM